jgi:hypothetical protein
MPTISTGAHTRRETHGLAGSLYEGAARRYELSGRRMGRTTTRPVMAQRGRTRAGGSARPAGRLRPVEEGLQVLQHEIAHANTAA